MSIKHSVNDTQLLDKDGTSANRSLSVSAAVASKQDTTILIHLFGQHGQNSLKLDKFKEFYRNLQQELIQIEFQEFARGKHEITPVDFARLVLRYSILHRSDQSPYIKRVYERTQPGDKGISQKQFEQFSGAVTLEDGHLEMRHLGMDLWARTFEDGTFGDGHLGMEIWRRDTWG